MTTVPDISRCNVVSQVRQGAGGLVQWRRQAYEGGWQCAAGNARDQDEGRGTKVAGEHAHGDMEPADVGPEN